VSLGPESRDLRIAKTMLSLPTGSSASDSNGLSVARGVEETQVGVWDGDVLQKITKINEEPNGHSELDSYGDLPKQNTVEPKISSRKDRAELLNRRKRREQRRT